MKVNSRIIVYAFFICLITLIQSCQEEAFVAEVDPMIYKSKLKSMSNYYYEESDRPNEKIFFFYDGQGRLSSYDRYQADGNDYTHTWRRTIKYFPEKSSYTQTTWSMVNGSTSKVLQKRNVQLNDDGTTRHDKIYNSENKLTRECTYTYSSSGYSVIIRQWNEEYEKFTITKVLCEVENEDVIRKQIFQSYFEDSPLQQEKVIDEYLFTHSTSANPLFEFGNLFTEISSIFRYADVESRNSTSQLTIKGNSENYVIDFSYTYEGDHIREVTPGGYMLHKRTFEYY